MNNVFSDFDFDCALGQEGRFMLVVEEEGLKDPVQASGKPDQITIF